MRFVLCNCNICVEMLSLNIYYEVIDKFPGKYQQIQQNIDKYYEYPKNKNISDV